MLLPGRFLYICPVELQLRQRGSNGDMKAGFYGTCALSLMLLCLTLGSARGGEEELDLGNLKVEYSRLLQAIQQGQSRVSYIVINTQDNRLELRRGREVLHRAICATGSGRKLEGPQWWKRKQRWVFDTPKGRFSVLRKVEDPLWTKPEWVFVEAGEEIPIFAEDVRRFQPGVLGKYALYFARDYMIHGTFYEINLGKSITHGCVRVAEEDLQYLYERVQQGWPVYIY